MLNESIIQKIHNISMKAEATDFHKHPTRASVYSNVVAHIVLTAKSGKKILAHLYAYAEIGNFELTESVYPDHLKSARTNQAREKLREHILSHFQKRTGICFHKGYFDFVDIETAR